MTVIKHLISKLLDRGEISADERTALEAFDPEKLTEELDRLRAKVEESEREKLGEKERMELDIRNLSMERDQLKASHDSLLRRQTVRELAVKSRFSDADYLDYLISRNNVDPADEKACLEFIEKMRLEKPDSFESTLKSGSGSGIAPLAQPGDGGVVRDRISNIIYKLENVSQGM